MIHKLKTKSEYFRAVALGHKKFEVRKNDRNFKVWDCLVLQEIDAKGNYTGKEITVSVRYILDAPEYCKSGFIIMSIK